MSALRVTDTTLAGVKLVQRQPRRDGRGFLARLFCAQELADAGWHMPVAQVNHTATVRRGTVRGLHYQLAPHAEMKLVSCLRGEVWDVAVDLRAGSPTFMQWFAERLSEANHRALLIPPGCAHGFQTLSDEVELLYCHSAPYVQQSERGCHPRDPRLDVRWPLAVDGLSERDAGHAFLADDFPGLGP